MTSAEIESDFWKEKLVLLSRQSGRVGKSVDSLKEISSEINTIIRNHPELNSSITETESYILWEITLSVSFKIRAYIQRLSKITFLSKEKLINGEETFTKIADAKFSTDPVSLLEHFINHFNQYERELNEKLGKNSINEKQKQIAFQFIKALLLKKYNGTNTIWNLENKADLFIIKTEKDGVCDEFSVTMENFPQLLI